MEIKEKTVMWSVIGVLSLAVLFLTFKTASITGSAVSTNIAADTIDTTGWTANEIMNYEMHGTIPARAQGKIASSASAGSGMIGSC